MVPGVTSIPIPGTAVGATAGRPRLPAARLRFEHFIAGPENALAVTAARELLGGRSGQFTPLVLCGRTGVGKSHLARGLARQWDKRQRRGPAVVVTADQFAQQLHAAIRSDSLASFRNRHRRTSLLVFEQLDTLPAKPTSVQHELIHTLDALHATGRFAIVTSRISVHTLADLEPLLRSRLLGGLVLKLSAPSTTARFEILRLSATTLSLPLSSDQLQRLAEQTTGGTVPDLVAALLEALQGPPDTAPTHRSPGSRKTNRAAPRSRTDDRIQRIITATARRFSLRPAQLRGQSRQRSIAMARGMALYLARELTGHSYATIGRLCGGRDHTTVLYHCRKIERLLQADAATRQTIEQLRYQLATRENSERQ